MTTPRRNRAPSGLSKLQFSCYLLRDNLTDVESALRPDYRPGSRKTPMAPVQPTNQAPEGIRAYFRPRSEKKPPWARALAPLFPALDQAMNMSNRFVIFLPVGSRYFAVCFGYGSSALEWSAIEGNFGLRFAARRIDSTNMREYRGRKIDETSRTQSVQVPVGMDIRDFGVTLEGEFARRLAGALDAEGMEFEGIEAIVASDAITFKLQTDLFRVQHVLQRMVDEVESRSAKEELRFVDSLEPLRSNSLIANQLDRLLADRLFDETSGSFADDAIREELSSLEGHMLELSPPDTVTIADVDQVVLSRGGRSVELPSISIEGLRAALSELGGRFGVNSLRNIKLMAYDSDGGIASDSQPLRNWVVFEAGDNEKRYILTLGKWFSLSEDYTRQLDADLAAIRDVTDILNLPDWDDDKGETPYNDYAAREMNKDEKQVVLFDTVDLRPADGDEVEACDLFHKLGYMVHVKRYTGSQTLSHLFSQGLVSARLLIGDEKYREAFLDAVSELTNDAQIRKAAQAAPTVVTYAIGFDKDKQLPAALPSFSKVNLRDFAKQLRESRITPTLCRIQIVTTGRVKKRSRPKKKVSSASA